MVRFHASWVRKSSPVACLFRESNCCAERFAIEAECVSVFIFCGVHLALHDEKGGLNVEDCDISEDVCTVVLLSTKHGCGLGICRL